ncbi:MAG TPA: NAD(P)-dependent oxidoreductase [Candidatus Paceibacterota bacterium]|nr:NAD(P)-dependent oxidoreductase [Candidatus Paceibacterota bacterium]
MKVLITGSQGFIGSYICQELLKNNYEVVGVDNYSKYGYLVRPQDSHPNFKIYNENVISDHYFQIVRSEKPDIIIGLAAMIGGIAYFHKYAYDLLAENERIMAHTFDSAIQSFKEGDAKRIIILSSSMVFEETEVFPTPEWEVKQVRPPQSTYGFQKLATEYFCKGAHEQYGLPYTIVRPFNCVGVGEDEALGEDVVTSGNVKLMLSHVLPDLVNKTLKGQDPLHILGEGNQSRCYTNGRDLGRAIKMVIENPDAINNDFNISTPVETTVLELAKEVWRQINGDKPFNYVCDKPFEYDVQKRIPDVTKAKEILGFEAEVSLEESVREVINYMKK